MSNGFPDMGKPISYLVVQPGLPVYGANGLEIGRVTHVLAAESEDIFEGFVIGLGQDEAELRFVDRDDIVQINERGVLVAFPSTDAARLHVPSENPAALRAAGDEPPPTWLEDRLKRAWDLISGNY